MLSLFSFFAERLELFRHFLPDNVVKKLEAMGRVGTEGHCCSCLITQKRQTN